MRGSNVLRALALAGATASLSAGVAQANTYSLSDDTANTTANPTADSYNIPGVYSFLQGSDNAPGTYTLLDADDTSHDANSGAGVYDTPIVDTVQVNPGDALFAHPGNGPHTSDAIIGFTSPITGTLDFSGAISDQNANAGGDGVNYFLAKGGALLTAGGIAEGGSTTIISTGVSVVAGDTIYLGINNGNNNDYSYDGTGVDFTINGTPDPTDCSMLIVNRDDPTAGGSDSADVPVTVPGGFDHVENIQVTNGVVTVPTVTRGSTAPFNVRTVKSVDGQRTEFSFDVVDVAGNVKHCT